MSKKGYCHVSIIPLLDQIMDNQIYLPFWNKEIVHESFLRELNLEADHDLGQDNLQPQLSNMMTCGNNLQYKAKR